MCWWNRPRAFRPCIPRLAADSGALGTPPADDMGTARADGRVRSSTSGQATSLTLPQLDPCCRVAMCPGRTPGRTPSVSAACCSPSVWYTSSNVSPHGLDCSQPRYARRHGFSIALVAIPSGSRGPATFSPSGASAAVATPLPLSLAGAADIASAALPLDSTSRSACLAKHPFVVGREYSDRRGRYEVLAIIGNSIKIRYADGRKAIHSIEIKARIHADMVRPRPGDLEPEAAWTGIYCLRDYNPYWIHADRNPAFRTATDGRLLDLKDNRDHGVENAARDFKDGLRQLGLRDGTVLAVVPGHMARASNEGDPLARVVALLARQDGRYVPMVDSLIRTETVEKKTLGGSRGVGVDLRSMKVTNPAALRNRTVVILDDVSTTGGTLSAARQLVERAGAKRTAAIALGRTVRYY